MTVRDHVGQFFDSAESRVESVARFLGAPCRDGLPIVCVSRRSHGSAIIEQMRRTGVPVDRAIAERRAMFYDAAQTLQRICRNGSPDATLFDQVIAVNVTEAARGGIVHAYGEIADILAERGDYSDAVMLEAFWNRLGARVPLTRLCGYAAAHFVAPETRQALRQIRAAHTDTRVQPQDPLASWLLTRE